MTTQSLWGPTDSGPTSNLDSSRKFLEELWEIALKANPSLTVEMFDALLDKSIKMLEEEKPKFDTTHVAFREFLLEALNAGTVSVTFRKVTGNKDIRTMLCTRNQEQIGKAGKGGGGVAPSSNEDPMKDTNVRVFDLDVAGWRSFRWDTIIDYCLEE
jgi:hypothetical protein